LLKWLLIHTIVSRVVPTSTRTPATQARTSVCMRTVEKISISGYFAEFRRPKSKDLFDRRVACTIRCDQIDQIRSDQQHHTPPQIISSIPTTNHSSSCCYCYCISALILLKEKIFRDCNPKIARNEVSTTRSALLLSRPVDALLK